MFGTIQIQDSPTPIYKDVEFSKDFNENEVGNIIELCRLAQRQITVDNLTDNLNIGGTTLYYVGSGEFSIAYKFVFNNKNYLIKLRNPLTRGNVNYIKELSLLISLKKDLEKELLQLGISLPHYYFATVDISCREYIDGQNINVNLNTEQILNIETILQKWLEATNRTNIHTDLRDKLERPTIKNFIQNKDKIFLVDPFINEE